MDNKIFTIYIFPFGFGAKKDRGTGFSVLVAREMKQEPKNESGGALLLTPFFAQSLTLVPRSLLLNRTETFATQASTSSTYNNVACIRVPASILYLGCVCCAEFSLLFSERFLSGCSSFSFSL